MAGETWPVRHRHAPRGAAVHGDRARRRRVDDGGRRVPQRVLGVRRRQRQPGALRLRVGPRAGVDGPLACVGARRFAEPRLSRVEDAVAHGGRRRPSRAVRRRHGRRPRARRPRRLGRVRGERARALPDLLVAGAVAQLLAVARARVARARRGDAAERARGARRHRVRRLAHERRRARARRGERAAAADRVARAVGRARRADV